MNARRFLGSFQEMTSYTDALSVITTLTTSSPWYCIAAFWWCLVLHLLKNHVPLDYPFSCIAGRAHTILVYTGLYTLPLILLAEHRGYSLARNPHSALFLIWYYCQPVLATLGHPTRSSGCSTWEGTWGTLSCCWGNEAHSFTLLLHKDEKGQNKQWHSMLNAAETFFQSGTPALRPTFTKVAFFLPFSSILLLLQLRPVIHTHTSEGRHFKSRSETSKATLEII